MASNNIAYILAESSAAIPARISALPPSLPPSSTASARSKHYT